MDKHFKINTSEKQIATYLYYGQKTEKQLYSRKQKELINPMIELNNFECILDNIEAKLNIDFNDYFRNNSAMLMEFEQLILLGKKLIFDNPQVNNYYYNSFSCPLGADTIFVSARGDFQICTKSDYSYAIGNINDGIDKNAIIEIYNNYLTILRKKCKKCWAISFCKLCPAQVLFDKKFYCPTDEDCNIIKHNADIMLKKYIMFSNRTKVYNTVVNFFENPLSNNYTIDNGPININNF